MYTPKLNGEAPSATLHACRGREQRSPCDGLMWHFTIKFVQCHVVYNVYPIFFSFSSTSALTLTGEHALFVCAFRNGSFDRKRWVLWKRIQNHSSSLLFKRRCWFVLVLVLRLCTTILLSSLIF